jgi:hypothetical protein
LHPGDPHELPFFGRELADFEGWLIILEGIS